MSEPTVKKIQRALRKEAKKDHSGEFIPYTISLQKWCELYGVPKHFDWIKNLILTKLEKDEDEDLGDYILFDADFYDLHFSHDGIFIFSDILQDFFGLERVRQMWKYIKALNEESKILFDVKQCLKSVSDERLQEYENTWTSYAAENSGIEMAQKVLSLIRDEKNSRSRRCRLFNHIKKMSTGCNQ